MKRLSRIDHDALQRAIVIGRKRDRATLRQIDEMLTERPRHEVGKFAAYGCQCDALHLKPWQWPPCWAEVNDRDSGGADSVFGYGAAAELLRRLLAAGLSRYEPDPINALARAERGGHEH
jgi:hypothetical protein